MKIFVCYPLARREFAYGLKAALKARRHQVLVDREAMAARKPLRQAMREAIARSDLFIFVVAPESVAPDSYTLDELQQARARWPSPAGRVLVVPAEPTPAQALPAYLEGCNWVEAGDDIDERTADAVDSLRRWGWGQRLPWRAIGAGAVGAGLLGLTGFAWVQFGGAGSPAGAAASPESQARAALARCENGAPADAFRELAALAAQPQARAGGEAVRDAQVDCAMAWLRDADVELRERKAWAGFVAPLKPLLVAAHGEAAAAAAREDASAAQRRRAADLQAHLGWADHLVWRDRHAPALNPVPAYTEALRLDPANPYAQAMWGAWLLAQTPVRAGLAGQRFEAALASGRATAFVRRLQLVGLSAVPESIGEVLRILDGMRQRAEVVDASARAQVFAAIYAQADRPQVRQWLTRSLDPQDALRTFLWLYPHPADAREGEKPEQALRWRLAHGLLLTQAGRGREARADLAALHAEARMTIGTGEFTREVDRLLSLR